MREECLANKTNLLGKSPEFIQTIEVLRLLSVLMAKRIRETEVEEEKLKLKLRKINNSRNGAALSWELVRPHIPRADGIVEDKLKKIYEATKRQHEIESEQEEQYAEEEVKLAMQQPATKEELKEMENCMSSSTNDGSVAEGSSGKKEEISNSLESISTEQAKISIMPEAISDLPCPAVQTEKIQRTMETPLNQCQTHEQEVLSKKVERQQTPETNWCPEEYDKVQQMEVENNFVHQTAIPSQLKNPVMVNSRISATCGENNIGYRGSSNSVEEKLEELITILREKWQGPTRSGLQEQNIHERDINTSRQGEYNVVDNLYNIKADISVGQLLDIAPALRTMLKYGISKEGRTKRVLIANAGKKLESMEDHSIPIIVGKKQLAAIIDGGANCNVILMDNVPIDRRKNIQKTNFIIRTASEDMVRPVGEIHDLAIVLDGKTILIDALVITNVGYDLLLGKPFLKSTNAITTWQADSYLFSIRGDQIEINCGNNVTGTKKLTNVRKVEVAEDLDCERINLLQSYKDVFANELLEVQTTDVVVHSIDTGTAEPVRAKPRRYAPKENEEILSQINELLETGKLEKSSSPWRSNLLLVPKPNGKWRMCVDFRPLNSLTVKDSQSLPNITELLDEFQGKSVFSTLDLFSGYFQIPLGEESKAKTAFWTKYGLFQYTVMPFGLCNAPATFQRAMESILHPVLHRTTVVYIDDIIISSKNFKEHRKDVEEVLELLREAKLKVNAKKTNLFQEKVMVLGFLIDALGVRIDPKRLEAIASIEVPKNRKELQSLLGVFGFCRRFVPNFALLALPLTRLLKKAAIWKWTDVESTAFNELKEKFQTYSFLAYPDFNKEFEVHTDASAYAIGAVISQGGQIVSTTSRKLSDAETRY